MKKMKFAYYVSFRFTVNIRFVECTIANKQEQFLIQEQFNNFKNKFSTQWRIQEANLAIPYHPVCQWDLAPQPAKNFARDDGHWAVYGTCQANIHVALLNVLSPYVFFGVEMVLKNALAPGLLPPIPLGELTALSQTPQLD